MTVAITQPQDKQLEHYVRKVAKAIYAAQQDKYLFSTYSKMGLAAAREIPAIEVSTEWLDGKPYLRAASGNKFVEIAISNQPNPARVGTDLYRTLWMGHNYHPEKI